MSDRAARLRTERRSAGLWLLLAGMCALPGCVEPLLPEKEDRSQFDGYDRARDRTVDQYRQDEFGRRRPNLRARLLTE